MNSTPEPIPNPQPKQPRILTRAARRAMARAGRKASHEVKRAAAKKGYQAMLQNLRNRTQNPTPIP